MKDTWIVNVVKHGTFCRDDKWTAAAGGLVMERYKEVFKKTLKTKKKCSYLRNLKKNLLQVSIPLQAEVTPRRQTDIIHQTCNISCTLSHTESA